MKNTFLIALIVFSIFFFAGNAFSLIMAEKESKEIGDVAKKEIEKIPVYIKDIKVIVVNPKVELGKKLFFDPILSKDGKVSCASCHKPDHGFSDNKPVSIGINGQNGDRNTPTVFNAFNLKFLFWDGRARSLEEQALGPIENPKEMGETIANVLKKLNSNPVYVKEFAAAFGQTPISTSQLVKAIAAFERTVISKDSDYDLYLRGEAMVLSENAKKGFDLFFGKAMCVECHKGSDFTDGDFHNIGLPVTNDVGRAKISINGKDTRKFKTPTLREVANTAPYFHKGQFETLEQVIAFYNSGGGIDTYKDPLKKPLNLNQDEQKNLIEFLKALSGRQEKIVPLVLPK